jgi:hypothetical protein
MTQPNEDEQAPSSRPDVAALRPVPESAWILRRIPKDAYDHTQPEGENLTAALFSKDDFKPSDDSYGSSGFCESDLPNGLDSLIEFDRDWRLHGVVRMQVVELRDFNIDVRYTPQDCDYADETLKDAHVSLIGIRDRGNRNRLVAYLQKRVWLRPVNRQ